MIPSRLLFPCSLLFGLVGCKDGVLTHIEVEGSATVTLEGASILEVIAGDLGFDDFVSMDITSEEELANQGVEPGDIKDVQLVLFELEATDPAGADLSFIDAMAVGVQAPGLAAATIASANDFPDGQSLVSFDLLGVDLTDYATSESMTLTTDVTGQRPDERTTVEARYILDVGVTLQGATRRR